MIKKPSPKYAHGDLVTAEGDPAKVIKVIKPADSDIFTGTFSYDVNFPNGDCGTYMESELKKRAPIPLKKVVEKSETSLNFDNKMTKEEKERFEENKAKFKERLLELGCHKSIAKRAAKYVDQYPASRYDNYGFVSAAINGTFDWDKTKEGHDFWQKTHDFYYTLETQILKEKDLKSRMEKAKPKKRT